MRTQRTGDMRSGYAIAVAALVMQRFCPPKLSGEAMGGPNGMIHIFPGPGIIRPEICSSAYSGSNP
eukprot:15438376-Alexandrium_andersonii.AAC.1